MATDFELTRNEIVRAAYEDCRVAIDGEELSAEQLTKGIKKLNAILKHLQAQGFHMWKLGEAWLFAKKGKAEYKLGIGGDLAGYDVKKNKIMAPLYCGFNVLFLNPCDNMPSVGDYIAVNINNRWLFTTTVTAVENNVVTINDILPCDVMCGMEVYFFTHLIDRPLKILQARRSILGGGNEIEMVNMENADYFRLPQKEQEGTPTSWTYVPTLDKGTFYLWNTPYANNIIIKFTYEQAFDILENSKDIPDIAQEWIEPLTWELAYQLSASCGLALDEREWLKIQAKESMAQARTFDQETGGFVISPDYRG